MNGKIHTLSEQVRLEENPLVSQAIDLAHLMVGGSMEREEMLKAAAVAIRHALTIVAITSVEESPIKSLSFMECEACNRKSGSPPLCPSCLHNREVISRLSRLRGE